MSSLSKEGSLVIRQANEPATGVTASAAAVTVRVTTEEAAAARATARTRVLL